MNVSICEAIREKRVIRFYYDNDLRIVEPFCYGENKKGHEVLRGYQIRGQSESQTLGWKIFTVSEITGLTITSECFDGRRLHYNPNDSAMVRFFARVLK